MYVITVRRDIQREHIDTKNKYTKSINGVAWCTWESRSNGKKAAITSESIDSISKLSTMVLKKP